MGVGVGWRRISPPPPEGSHGGGRWDIEGLSEERQAGEGVRRKGFGIGFCTHNILG